MRASLDTNVIIHFYRAGLQDILFDFFNEGVFIYEQIRNIELENYGGDILDRYFKSEVKIDYIIRELQQTEVDILNDFLYEAIFIPEGIAAPSRDIIYQPELQVYVKDFGKVKDDIALVAEAQGKIIGAVWVRIMDDYGHIDDLTPSFAISLYKQYRNKGIGTALMKRMLNVLQERKYKQASLAVQKSNYAVKMYQDLGFEIMDENAEEYIMVCKL